MQFIGRDSDIKRLRTWLKHPPVRVICISGESGVGKTALANRLLETKSSPRFHRRLRRFVYRLDSIDSKNRNGQLAGPKALMESIVASIVRELIPNLHRNATAEEQRTELFKAVAGQDTLMVLDNAEMLELTSLQRFASDWLATQGSSTLILTTTESKPLSSTQKNLGRYEHYQLRGLSEEASLCLLGTNFAERFDTETLREIAKTLGGNPQRLLYLKWLDPKSEEELQHLSHELRSQHRVADLGTVIKKKIDGPVAHFVALGRVRSVEIEEGLLLWLWDKLGGGSSTKFNDVLDQLIESSLLIGERHGGYRLNPSIHIQLERHLTKHLGPLHLSHIDYFISAYYRRQLTLQEKAFDEAEDQQSTKALDPEVLQFYIYHALEGKNVVGAFEYLLDPARLRKFHHWGQAIGLKNVFIYFDSYLESRLGEVRENLEKLRQEAQASSEGENREDQTKILAFEREAELLRKSQVAVKVELAHCLNDLSEHEECLRYLESAERNLGDAADDESLALRRNIYYLRGISNSDLGQPLDCIQAYRCVVEQGLRSGDRPTLDERGILALCYLAFELRFVDRHRAVALGRKAVELAKEHGEPSVIAKSSCSLAQTTFFENYLDESRELFKTAQSLCEERGRGPADRRELGRILIHRAMIPMSRGEYEEAIDSLIRSEQLNNVSHDRRRIATSWALRGICRWRQGHQNEGLDLLGRALDQHYEINDFRNLISESLSYAFFLGRHNAKEAFEAARAPECQNATWAKVLTHVAARRSLDVFVNYWAQRFRPLLLE